QCSGDSPLCNTTSGLCTVGCTLDSECMSTQWCDAPSGGTGLCQDKLPNGDPLPSMPAEVATCSTDVAIRVCVSAVCDATTETCGGTACAADGDCAATEFCGIGGVCAPKLPTGRTCDRSAECQTNDCNRNVCSAVVAQGNGLLCAVSAPGSSDGKRSSGVLLLLAIAGLGIARRRPARRIARRAALRR
ncbi:MAG TPA: hypothetical protein VF294_17975, partial [Polyangiaceae bacterium]